MSDVEPLVSQEVDLRDFDYMPLQVARLRDSGLAAHEDPAECWFAVLLWCASWHQVPAASLPNDDKELAAFAGFGRVVKEWQKVKKGALRGWILCSDGRLYHPVVAEKANEAWLARLKHQHKQLCDRIRLANKRNQTNQPLPLFDEWLQERMTHEPSKTTHGETLRQPQETNATTAHVAATLPTNRSDNGLKGREGKGYLKPTAVGKETEQPEPSLWWHDPDKALQLGKTLHCEPRVGEDWNAFKGRLASEVRRVNGKSAT